MHKKRICYIVSTLKSSGPINILKSIINYIDKEKNNIYILSLSPEPASSIRDELVEMGVTCINLEVSRKNIFKLIKRLKQTVNNIIPDIIHSHGLRPDIILLLFLQYKYKCCCTIHNYAPMDYKMTYGSLIGGIASYLHLKAIRKIDHPISCSQSIADQLRVYDLKVDVIQNGVDTSYFFPPFLEKKAELRKQLSLDHNSTVFISVGHLTPKKNPLFILQEFSKYNGEFTLLFIGDGTLRPSLATYSYKLKGNVIFTGHVSNVLDYLQASDYFISASKAEGLPNTVLEAGAVGLPLILSNIPSHKEILSKNKNTGYSFTAGDINGLISVLNNLQITDSRKYQEMSKSARDLIIDNFSAEGMSKKYQDSYKKMVSTGPVRE
ncbi:hypothetical protein ES705_14028 [subsurface metagenome]